jgi:hypothetical protein
MKHDPSALMTRQEVMAYFRIGHTKCDRLIASDELKSLKDGASRRVWRWSCEERMERLKKGRK